MLFCLSRVAPAQRSAILPGMSERPKIAIVGSGNLGRALAISLERAGYVIETIVRGRTQSSLKRARALARKVGADVRSDLHGSKATVVWVCVPDSRIASASSRLASNLHNAKGLIVLHSSGALTSEELQDFRKKGAAVASAHPLMTFVADSRPTLTGVPFAVEGNGAAVRLARRIIKDLGGTYHPIRKADKSAYHAWGAFASPLLTSLLAASERVAELAGVEQKSARRRMIPILKQTLANYASFGPARAFSGPIVRGDVETVRKHLQVLRKAPPLLNAYVALAQSALEYLPSKGRIRLGKLLHYKSRSIRRIR